MTEQHPATRGRRPRSRTVTGIAAGAVAVAALLLGPVAAASAHVSVEPSTDIGGSRAILTFRVPTESADTRTTGLRIQLPSDTPFQSVRVRPVAGWQAELVREELPEPVDDGDGNAIEEAVTEIVWTATGDGLAPDEYEEFEVSVSPLPESGTVYFPTVQSYSDGREVDWVQQAAEGAEPEHPAPSIEVVAGDGEAADSHGVGGEEHASAEEPGTGDAGAAEPRAADDRTPLTLAIAALGVAIVAAIAAGIALVSRRG